MSEDIDFEADPQEPEIVEETLPAVVEFETQAVVATLVQFDKQVALMVERAKGITTITDTDTNEKAVEWGAQAKRLHKRLEELRKYYVEPHNKFLSTVNNFFKRYQEPLKALFEDMGRKAGAYRQYLENERRRKQAEMDAEARRLQAQIEEQAEKDAEAGKAYEVAPVLAPILPEVPHVTRTSEGSASQRKRWVARLEDITKVSRDYMVVDQKKVDAFVKGGGRQLDGFIIEEVLDTSFRV